MMLVRPVASYGCLTCGFRCFSSQMIQLHWRHWHHAFVAPAPIRPPLYSVIAKQVEGTGSTETAASIRSRCRSTSPTPTASPTLQSKHPTGAIFKDKNVSDTNTTLATVKHWAVSGQTFNHQPFNFGHRRLYRLMSLKKEHAFQYLSSLFPLSIDSVHSAANSFDGRVLWPLID